jgi:hypothetical protein
MHYIAGLLTAILMIAKLGGYATISWLMVFAPLLIWAGMALLILIVMVAIAALVGK